ncbi:MAG: hypothetical protein DRP24_06570, partial [Thermotoga sp.]
MEMNIKRIYITHTCYCSGWNLDGIYENTIFRKSMHTNQKWEEDIKMLDWDFKHPNWQKHIKLVKEHDFECVMAPDCFSEKTIEFTTKCADKLLKYCDRVVIPIHYYDDRLEGYELAFPITTKFNPKSRQKLGFISEFA